MIVMTNENRSVAWIGRLHVRPLPGGDGGLHGAAGAYATVFALALSAGQFAEMVADEMASLGLTIVEMADVRLYHPDAEDDVEVIASAHRLSVEWPVQYHDFFTYPHDDA